MAVCQSVLGRMCLHISHVSSEVRDLGIILQRLQTRQKEWLSYFLSHLLPWGAPAGSACRLIGLAPGARSAAAVELRKLHFSSWEGQLPVGWVTLGSWVTAELPHRDRAALLPRKAQAAAGTAVLPSRLSKCFPHFSKSIPNMNSSMKAFLGLSSGLPSPLSS